MSKNSFKNNLQFAKIADVASSQEEKEHPFFGEEVYKNLPECLKPFFIFSSARENDIFLNALIPAVGIALFKVSGQYDGRIYYPTLFSATCAPAASGKGVQNYIHNFLSKIEEAFKEKYAGTLKLNRLSIPANSSAAAVCTCISENDIGMINETEIDELVNTMNQEWGDYSTIIRRSFQHEKIHFSRKEGGYFSVDCPKLSIALAGTRQQFINLFKDAENGTFSRFATYMFSESSGFRDVRPKPNATPYAELIEKATEKLLPVLFNANAQPVNFKFTEDQWDRFVKRFQELEKEITAQYGDSATSSLMRLAVIYFRIAMTFTVLRAGENGQIKPDIYCTEVDFMNAGRLIKVYKDNFISALKMMPREAVKIENRSESRLFEVLPVDCEFSTAEAKVLAKEHGIGSDRSVDSYIRNLRIKGLIMQLQHGTYKKVMPN